jgi:hypothetical protein
MIYTGLKDQGETPLNYQYILKKRRVGGKQFFYRSGTTGRRAGTRKREMRVNMVDVFCIHI